MTDISTQQLDQVLIEIASLKSIVSQNKTMLYQITLPRHFRTLSFLMAVVVFVFSLMFAVLIRQHGTYGDIPAVFRISLNCAIAVLGVIMLPIVAKTWGDSLKKENRELSLEKAIERFLSYRVWMFLFPLSLCGVVFIIYFFVNGNAYFIIPTLAMVSGLRRTLIGYIGESILWTVSGYWFLATAMFISLNPISAPLAASLSFGCGYLLFAFSSLLADKYHG